MIEGRTLEEVADLIEMLKGQGHEFQYLMSGHVCSCGVRVQSQMEWWLDHASKLV